MEKIKRVKIEEISKCFNIGHSKNRGALSRFISGREPKKRLKVIDNISFFASSGEIIGIIGKNGSGKSTFLRLIAGIYKQDKGIIRTHGKIISLINMTKGFKERLTMRENIFLICSLFGMSSTEIRRRIQDIIIFSELSEYIDTKMYQFSSGMENRLAFSIAINCRPDILLLDEVFEVGDEEFKKKSSSKIKELAKKGTTVFLVSHDIKIISKYCSRAIWLDKGKVKMDGTTRKIIDKYLDNTE